MSMRWPTIAIVSTFLQRRTIARLCGQLEQLAAICAKVAGTWPNDSSRGRATLTIGLRCTADAWRCIQVNDYDSARKHLDLFELSRRLL